MSKPANLTQSARPQCVLVVEDDLVNQTYLRVSLQKRGYEVVPVISAEAAHLKVDDLGFDHFSCILTDHWLPGRTGLDLVDWVTASDPTLSCIMLTAEEDRKVITEALRRGVSDFLEKPVNLQKLFAAIVKAIDRTGHQRQMARSESAVKDLGRAQLWMTHAGQLAAGKLGVEICFHPKLEAGGDFLGHFQITPDLYCCLLTDVSGHDLRAAYISAYFHGIFRGMLQHSAPLPEIFGYFNHFLINEWNQSDQLKTNNSVGTSLAATAVLLDSRQQTASVLICGAPEPVYVFPDGRAHTIGMNAGPPLGWFPDLNASSVSHSIREGGAIYLWTDGLTDLAEARGIHPFCMGFGLQQARKKSVVPSLAGANDDILFAAIRLPSPDTRSGQFLPLLAEEYRGDQSNDIDSLVAGWQRNLRFAFPEIKDSTEHDILLASREAVLNALEHGCQRQPDKTMRFHMAYHEVRDAIRVCIDDPGNGHQFDFATHAENVEEELIDEHRGLILITNLAQRLKFERNGASLTLDFQL